MSPKRGHRGSCGHSLASSDVKNSKGMDSDQAFLLRSKAGSKNKTSSHAKSIVESLCEWCGESFRSGHQRRVSTCCGCLIGDSCFEEMYDEHNFCSKCSSKRPVEANSASIPMTDLPVYTRRFTNVPQVTNTLNNPVDQGNTEPNLPGAYAITSSSSQYPTTCPEPLYQASAEAKQAFQARTRVINALEQFMHVWTIEVSNLRDKDRRSIASRAQTALSGKSLPLPSVGLGTASYTS